MSENYNEEIKEETPDTAQEEPQKEAEGEKKTDESEAEVIEEVIGEVLEEEAGEEADPSEEAQAEEEGPGKEKEKTSFFGKKKKEDKAQQQIDELNDKVRRTLAEFDNYRKRTEKEKINNYAIGARDIVVKILPVVDNFERGLQQAKEGDSFADGMKMIYKQLMTTLEDLGVKPIEAVGQKFDPNFHNAVMHVEDESAEENTVIEEFQKGYTYKDFVIRCSMVKVAN